MDTGQEGEEEDPTSAGGMGKVQPLRRCSSVSAMLETDSEKLQTPLAQLRQQQRTETEQLYSIVSILSDQLKSVIMRNEFLEKAMEEKDRAVNEVTEKLGQVSEKRNQDEHQNDPSTSRCAQIPSTWEGWRWLCNTLHRLFQRVRKYFSRERLSTPSLGTDAAPPSRVQMQNMQRALTELILMLERRRVQSEQVAIMKEVEITSRKEVKDLKAELKKEKSEIRRLAALLLDNIKKTEALDDKITEAKAEKKEHNKLSKQFSKLVCRLKKKDLEIEGLQQELAELKARMDDIGAGKAEENNK